MKKNNKKYIHELFNPKMETASEVIGKVTKDFLILKFEEVIHINDYEAVCIFSYKEL